MSLSLSFLLKLFIMLPMSVWADCGSKNEKQVIARNQSGYTAVWKLKVNSKLQSPLSDPRERHRVYASWASSKTTLSAKEILANHLMILKNELNDSSDRSNPFEQALGREQRNVQLVLSGRAGNIRSINCIEGLVFNEFLKVVDLRYKSEEFFSSMMIKGPEIRVIVDFYGDPDNLRVGGAAESIAASAYRHRLLREGWTLYASYHNHPFSFDNSYGDLGGNLAPSEADISLYREQRPPYALITNGLDTIELTEKDYLAFEQADRLEQIKQLADSFDEDTLKAGVRIEPNPSFKGLAGSYQIQPGSFLIHYNPKIFNSLSESARSFVLFHEMGHVRLGHTAKPYPGPEEARSRELEADLFAAFIYLKLRGAPDAGLLDFFKIVRGQINTVPSGPERLSLIEKVMQKAATNDERIDVGPRDSSKTD